MKIVIDIPEEAYKNLLNNYSFSSEEIPIISLAIATGTPLPDNATNGDMIKALFPNADIDESQYQTPFIDVSMNGELKSFHADWWNAPYKAEGSERECG